MSKCNYPLPQATDACLKDQLPRVLSNRRQQNINEITSHAEVNQIQESDSEASRAFL